MDFDTTAMPLFSMQKNLCHPCLLFFFFTFLSESEYISLPTARTGQTILQYEHVQVIIISVCVEDCWNKPQNMQFTVLTKAKTDQHTYLKNISFVVV